MEGNKGTVEWKQCIRVEVEHSLRPRHQVSSEHKVGTVGQIWSVNWPEHTAIDAVRRAPLESPFYLHDKHLRAQHRVLLRIVSIIPKITSYLTGFYIVVFNFHVYFCQYLYSQIYRMINEKLDDKKFDKKWWFICLWMKGIRKWPRHPPQSTGAVTATNFTSLSSSVAVCNSTATTTLKTRIAS